MYFSCEGRVFPKKKSSMESARFRSVGTEDHAPVRECTQSAACSEFYRVIYSFEFS